MAEEQRQEEVHQMEIKYRKFVAHLEYAEMLRRNIEATKGKASSEPLATDCITKLLVNNKAATEALDQLVK